MERIYDDRNKEVSIFEGSTIEYIVFMHTNWDENDNEFKHIWMEKIEE